ncbi:MAG: PorT family protein [Pseudarcicella sp.]|nr:PorT family protein [Pseudarcicella sp.]MBP6411265.1 PorT family protein [Pseudarcicella sp.]
MKTFFASIFFIAFISFQVSAQDIAFKVGYNYSDVLASPEPLNAFTNRQSFHAGLAIKNIKISPKIGIQPELLFSNQGFSVASYGDVSLNYISLPILFTFPVTEGLDLQVGPQFNYLLNADLSIPKTIFSLSYKGLFNDFDAGAVAGLEYQVHKNISLGGRYYLGMANVNKDFTLGTTTTLNDYFNLNNTNAQLFVSFSFGK